MSKVVLVLLLVLLVVGCAGPLPEVNLEIYDLTWGEDLPGMVWVHWVDPDGNVGQYHIPERGILVAGDFDSYVIKGQIDIPQNSEMMIFVGPGVILEFNLEDHRELVILIDEKTVSARVEGPVILDEKGR